MINPLLFDFSRDLQDASRYRLSLKNSSRGSDLQKLESFLLPKLNNFNNLVFKKSNYNEVLNVRTFNFDFKNYMFYFFYSSRSLKRINNQVDFFNTKTIEYLKVLNKDIKNLNSLIKATNIKLNSKYNKVKVYSIFKEKDFLEVYDLFDDKRKLSFKDSMQSDYKSDCISAPIRLTKDLNIVCIEVCEEESYGSDNLTQLDVTKDTSFLYRDEKVFNYIVGKHMFNETGQIKKDRPVSLSLIIHFSGYQELNNIFIESSSGLPIRFDIANLFYNNEENQWVNVNNVSESDNYNRKNIYFNRIRSNKIKIKLFQEKYYDSASLVDEDIETHTENILLQKSFLNYNPVIKDKQINKVYDLSILKLEVKRKVYKGYGFYREALPLFINQPLSFTIDQDYLYEDEECFVEKECHIVLYGEKDFKAYKKKNKNFNKTSRVNLIVPVSNNASLEREALTFIDKKCNLKLFPLISKTNLKLEDCISLYKNEIKLTIGNDYSISFNDGATYIEDGNTLVKTIEDSLSFKLAGEVQILIKAEPSNNAIYKTEYLLENIFFLNHEKTISYINNEIVFDKKLNNSVGFLRPRFIFRNLSKNNESSLIKEYRVLVEELEENVKEYIEYEDFVEVETRGSSNVIQ